MAEDIRMVGNVALLLWAQTLGLTGAQTTQLLVEPPWRPAVLWDQVTLTCQGSGTADVTTWYKDGQHWGQEGKDHLTVTESGTYTCDRPGSGLSPPVSILDDELVLQVPARTLLEGDTVTLRCRGQWNSTVTRVRFYQDENNLTGSINATELSLSPLQLNHSGRYSCRGLVGSFISRSAAVTVTVHVPVANVTITPGPLSHQVRAGDKVTLHCSVQVGSAPVTFTWLHNGQEVARGPLLEFGNINMEHSGTYQCVATNQLDGHHLFRALSPELALDVTPWDRGTHRDTVAAAVGGALLLLLLLVGVIVAWCQWHSLAARKQQERAPPDPPAPPEEEEVLYTHVVVNKRAGASPYATTLQDP